MSTSTHLPLCVYCGTARPADESRCPQCGRPWIDVRVGFGGRETDRVKIPAMVGAASSAATAPAPAAAPDTAVTAAPQDPPVLASEAEEAPALDADDEAPPPPDADVADGDTTPDPSQRFVWLIPALIAGAAIIVVALFGLGLLDGEAEPEAAAAPTVAPTPTTAAPTTTTEAPTTTTAPSTTTTTTTIPEPADIPPVGNAISMSSLTLKAGGIGPVVLGDGALDAVGRLVASLGRPEETGIADETLGLCPGEDGRFVRWSGLTAVVSGTLEDGTFVGYRYEEEPVPTMHVDLATPSGLRLGDPVSALKETYSSYQIDFVSDGGTDLFRLSDADGLLLWGPVSSIEDSGRVEGIHSPDACTSQGG